MNGSEVKTLKGLRVLVVEDNEIIQRIVSRIFNHYQASAHTAENGKIALQMVSENVYDAVLMDIMMPELDGYDTTCAIRSIEGTYFRDLPIFAFTTSPDTKKISTSSMNGRISKSPIDKEELYQKLSPYLK
ncbi:MAG: response regulator [bacterium]